MKLNLSTILISFFAVSVSSCGDGLNICPTVTITSPPHLSTVNTDSDIDKPGVQANVTVTSTLEAGAMVTLRTGSETTTSTADADGNLLFSNVTLPLGNATLVVEPEADCNDAGDTAEVTVQLSPIASLTVTTQTRQSARLDWVGDTEGDFVIKYDTAPIDDSNFDDTTTGKTISVDGNLRTRVIDFLLAGRDTGSGFIGTSYYFAVAARDQDNNRSLPVGGDIPRAVDFRKTGPILPPNAGNDDSKLLGFSLAKGLFNNDQFYDIAVAAPFLGRTGVSGEDSSGAVYLFLGTEEGIRDTASYVIPSAALLDRFGRAITSIHWFNDGSCGETPNGQCHDLVATRFGPPTGSNKDGGEVMIFRGGADFADVGDQDVPIEVPLSAAETRFVLAATPGWFGEGFMGAVASARFDSDDLDDLVVGIVGAGSSRLEGGAFVVYGGGTDDAPITGTVELSSVDDTGLNGARIHYYPYPFKQLDPGADTSISLFGSVVQNIGPTIFGNDDIAVTPNITAISHQAGVYVWRFGDALTNMLTKPNPDTVEEVLYDPIRDLVIQASDNTSGITMSRFGQSVGTISTVNGDLTRDIVVTAPRDGPLHPTDSTLALPEQGVVYIVDGSKTGAIKTDAMVDGFPFTLIEISGDEDRLHFGARVLNNHTARNGIESADLDMDKKEELIIVAGITSDNAMYIWYNDSLEPNTSIETTIMSYASADHVVLAPSPEFNGQKRPPANGGEPITMNAIWAGDVNNDGLEDICWASIHNANAFDDRDGVIEVLYDNATE